MKPLQTLFFILICVVSAIAQDTTETVKTFCPDNRYWLCDFEVQKSTLKYYIRWRGESPDYIFFCEDSCGPKGQPLRIRYKEYPSIKKRNFVPFYFGSKKTETENAISANTLYFEWLRKAHALHPNQFTPIGKLSSQVDINKNTAVEFSQLLLKYGVVGTYGHIRAHIRMTDLKENDTFIHIYYYGIHYFCTSKCDEGDYYFVMHFNKRTNEICLSSSQTKMD